MNIDDVFVKLSEFNKRVQEVENVNGDVLGAYKMTGGNDTKQTVDSEDEPYILQYPYTTSSAEFAADFVATTIGNDTDSDELSDEMVEEIRNMAVKVFKVRVNTISMSVLPPDVYRTVKNVETLKMFLSTDKNRVVMKNFVDETSTVSIVHMPYTLATMLKERSVRPHNELWNTYVVMNDPNGEMESYEMGLVREEEMVNTLMKITKQHSRGDKVIAL